MAPTLALIEALAPILAFSGIPQGCFNWGSGFDSGFNRGSHSDFGFHWGSSKVALIGAPALTLALIGGALAPLLGFIGDPEEWL